LNTLICKGAVEEVLSLCHRVEVKGEVIEVLPEHDAKRRQLADDLNGQGFRVIALAYKQMPGGSDEPVYSVKDESDLILLGFLAFLDPPKDTATEALTQLHSLSVDVKVLTGDNEIITAYICKEVGMPVEHLLLGSQIETMNEAELAEAASTTSVFARLAPAHKERIIRALQSKGHVLSFMGDGINDAPALKAADVGISVNSAVDIAKESSDIILLENSLLVLEQGVLEGRRVDKQPGRVARRVEAPVGIPMNGLFDRRIGTPPQDVAPPRSRRSLSTFLRRQCKVQIWWLRSYVS
jgi:P-type Mg2+ transporter